MDLEEIKKAERYTFDSDKQEFDFIKARAAEGLKEEFIACSMGWDDLDFQEEIQNNPRWQVAVRMGKLAFRLKIWETFRDKAFGHGNEALLMLLIRLYLELDDESFKATTESALVAVLRKSSKEDKNKLLGSILHGVG